MSEDYYQTLGVSRGASQAEIDKAYRELARKHHPDVNPDDKGAKDRFKRIQAAFDVLGNADKRKKYDLYGADFEHIGGGPRGGFRGQVPPGFADFDFDQLFGRQSGGGQAGFEDILRQFGGAAGARTGTRTRRGRDIHHELTVPFATAVLGGEAQLHIRRTSGETETISVKIPPGIENGKKIRLRGQGEKPPRGGGPAGDIMITVHVSPHPCFARRGNHLEIKVPLTVSEAVLGAKVEIPSPKGSITLTVPPGTSGGTKLRVKGQGIAPPKGAAGDLFAEIQIIVPKKIDQDTAELFRQIGKKEPENPRGGLMW